MATASVKLNSRKSDAKPSWCTDRQWKLMQSNKLGSAEFDSVVFNKMILVGLSLIDRDQVEKLDAAIMRDAFGQFRCVGLLIASDPWAKLNQNILHDRKVAVALASATDGIEEYAKNLEQLASLLLAASMRVKVSLLGREDMDAVIAEANTPEEETANV